MNPPFCSLYMQKNKCFWQREGVCCERFCVCLWPLFPPPAVSVEALWRLHALLYLRKALDYPDFLLFSFFTSLQICDHSGKLIKFYFAVDEITLVF